MPVVTIRGRLGSGVPEIGRQVADRLRVDYVDREINRRSGCTNCLAKARHSSERDAA